MGSIQREPNTVARRLSESGAIPSGGPARAPDLDEDDTLRLIVGIATSPKLRLADKSVSVYEALSPAGSDIPDNAPDSVPRTAAEAIAVEVECARGGNSTARLSFLTFIRSWPEVVIERPGGTMRRFRQTGENAAHWKRDGHRTATTIPVSAIANILDDLFGKVTA
ncbi:hypothetical protein [Bradyrhizobium sp. LB13.1]